MLGALESGSFKLNVKNIATMASRDMLYPKSSLPTVFIGSFVISIGFIHIGMGFGVARSTFKAMLEPQCLGRVAGDSHTFLCIANDKCLTILLGSRGLKL